MNNYLEKVNIDNDIECLLIKPCLINHLDYNDINYIDNIINMNCVETIIINANNFTEQIVKYLDADIYKDEDLHTKNDIFHEEPYNIYEIMYLDIINNKVNENEFANLIAINDDKIYTNAILFKTNILSLNDEMKLVNFSKKDLQYILKDRVNITIILYDDIFTEKKIFCNKLEEFAQEFFENEYYEKYETLFLMHNINIWYTTLFGLNNICGKLINKPIYKCIIFSKKSENALGNLTLDECNKIINLSLKLDDYEVPKKYLEEKNDSLGRKIIYNKYKVLDLLSNEFLNK
jgi:hypothetical protein